MIVLPGHRTEIAHLPEQPLDRVNARAHILCQEATGLLGKIEQDRPGLENCNRLAAAGRCVIEDGGNSVVGGDDQKLRLELFALADIHRHDLVRQAGLLEKHRDLVAVGRGPIVDIDHGRRSLH